MPCNDYTRQGRRSFAAYYARLAEIVMAYFGPEQGVRGAYFTLAQELPNGRAALQWAEERQEAELRLRLTGFTRLWHVRGQMNEAERWMERILELDLWAREPGKQVAPLTLHIGNLYGLGRTLARHGKVERGAEAAAYEALHLAQSIGDQTSISSAFTTLGMIAQASGKLDGVEAAFTESHTHASLMEQSCLMSRILVGLTELAGMWGDVARATALLGEAFANAHAIGMQWDIAMILTLLGHLARQQRGYAVAKARYREALALYRTFGSLTPTQFHVWRALLPLSARKALCAGHAPLCGSGGPARSSPDAPASSRTGSIRAHGCHCKSDA